MAPYRENYVHQILIFFVRNSFESTIKRPSRAGSTFQCDRRGPVAITLSRNHQRFQKCLNSSLAAEKQKSASIQAKFEEAVLAAERLQKSASLKAEFDGKMLALEKQSHAQAIEEQRHLLGVEKKKTSRLEVELARQKDAKQKAEKKLDRAESELEECMTELDE